MFVVQFSHLHKHEEMIIEHHNWLFFWFVTKLSSVPALNSPLYQLLYFGKQGFSGKNTLFFVFFVLFSILIFKNEGVCFNFQVKNFPGLLRKQFFEMDLWVRLEFDFWIFPLSSSRNSIFLKISNRNLILFNSLVDFFF